MRKLWGVEGDKQCRALGLPVESEFAKVLCGLTAHRAGHSERLVLCLIGAHVQIFARLDTVGSDLKPTLSKDCWQSRSVPALGGLDVVPLAHQAVMRAVARWVWANPPPDMPSFDEVVPPPRVPRKVGNRAMKSEGADDATVKVEGGARGKNEWGSEGESESESEEGSDDATQGVSDVGPGECSLLSPVCSLSIRALMPLSGRVLCSLLFALLSLHVFLHQRMRHQCPFRSFRGLEAPQKPFVSPQCL